MVASARFNDAVSAASAVNGRAFMPTPPTAVARVLSASARRAIRATSNPLDANRLAIASPTPGPAPTATKTFAIEVLTKVITTITYTLFLAGKATISDFTPGHRGKAGYRPPLGSGYVSGLRVRYPLIE